MPTRDWRTTVFSTRLIVERVQYSRRLRSFARAIRPAQSIEQQGRSFAWELGGFCGALGGAGYDVDWDRGDGGVWLTRYGDGTAGSSSAT